jgi:hypothetical protein
MFDGLTVVVVNLTLMIVKTNLIVVVVVVVVIELEDVMDEVVKTVVVIGLIVEASFHSLKLN